MRMKYHELTAVASDVGGLQVSLRVEDGSVSISTVTDVSFVRDALASQGVAVSVTYPLLCKHLLPFDCTRASAI